MIEHAKIRWSLALFLSLLFVGCGPASDDYSLYVPRVGHPRLAAGGTLTYYFKRSHRGFWSGDMESGFAQIDTAWTDDPDIAVVEQINESDGDELWGEMSVHAIRPGRTYLHVKPVGDDVIKTIPLRVSEAVKLKFGKNPCLTEQYPTPVGGRAQISYSLYDREMVQLYGGIGERPFSVDPENLLDSEDITQPPGGRVTIRSKIDDVVRKFLIADASDITHLNLAPLQNVGDSVNKGQMLAYDVHGRAFGKTPCYDSPLEDFFDYSVDELTPEVCWASGRNGISVEAHSLGTCRFRVSFPDVNGGQGWTTEQSFQVIDPSTGGE